MIFNSWLQTDRNIYLLKCYPLNIDLSFKSLVEAKRKAEALGFKLKSPLWYNYNKEKTITYCEYVDQNNNTLLMFETPNENYNDEKRKTDLRRYLISNVITKV